MAYRPVIFGPPLKHLDPPVSCINTSRDNIAHESNIIYGLCVSIMILIKHILMIHVVVKLDFHLILIHLTVLAVAADSLFSHSTCLGT